MDSKKTKAMLELRKLASENTANKNAIEGCWRYSGVGNDADRDSRQVPNY